MYLYRTKRFGLLIILAICATGGWYRSAHSLSFNPPEVHKTLLEGHTATGWHAQYSKSSLQAVHNALTHTLQKYYNEEKGINLYFSGLRPDYEITVNYSEKLDHSLNINVLANPRHGTKEKLKRQIHISSNTSLSNLLEAEVLIISQRLAKEGPLSS